MKLVLRSLFLLLCIPLSACSATIDGLVGKPGDLTDPGWFDVGLGFGDTLSGAEASGVLLSVKAYPTGRWYAFKKSADDVATGQLMAAQKELQKLQVDPNATANQKQTAQTKLEHARADALAISLRDPDQVAMQIDGTTWHNRISFFLAQSIGDFDANGGSSGSIAGSFTGFGLGYDIAPQFAIQAGYGLFQPDGSSSDDGGAFVAVSLNANAFRALLGEVGSSN